MAVLCQLADPSGYRACDWDYAEDPEDFAYWLNLFADFPKHIEAQLRQNFVGNDDFENRWRNLCAEYGAGITARQTNPADFGVINTIKLCEFRQSMLNKHGFDDPYKYIKQRENEAAARMYPAVVEGIDATAGPKRWETLFRSLFAGNIFDLGSPKAIELYQQGPIDFASISDMVPHRPWFIDHADAMCDRLMSPNPWRQVLFFVDNSGPDIVLGVIPLVREMARVGTRVVMAANSTPALNDITIEELDRLLNVLAERDTVLADMLNAGRMGTVDSGNGTPLIDLSGISDMCNQAAAESDLIVLEGMGRGVESNWKQTFKCDIWRLALIKDENVAKWLRADLFDAVCRFDPAQ